MHKKVPYVYEYHFVKKQFQNQSFGTQLLYECRLGSAFRSLEACRLLELATGQLLWLLQNPKTRNEPLDKILGLFREESV
jgi:hypothetical protein